MTPSSRSRTSSAICGKGKRAYPASPWKLPTKSASPLSPPPFSIIAVFVPVSFMSGGMGVFFREFGLTVAVAALFSLVVARLITPMMAAFFLSDMRRTITKPKPGVLTLAYRDVLSWSIKQSVENDRHRHGDLRRLDRSGDAQCRLGRHSALR